MLSATGYLAIGLAAIAAGLVNAIAGGGSLISFPALTAAGLPAVMANVTNTLALTPGYLGATGSQRRDLGGQRRRVKLLLPAAALGGLVGGELLLLSDEKLFGSLVPWLILLGTGLLALQEPLRAWLLRHEQQRGFQINEAWTIGPVFLASVYGGYFGAGLGVILLAVLALLLDDSLTRLNGLKQILSLVVNGSAALLFLFSSQVHWPAVVVMALGALVGGALGGRVAGQVNPGVLRRLVVLLGLVVAVVFFLR